MMRKLLDRARRGFRYVRDAVPLTLLGALVAVGAGLSLKFFGLGHQDLILLVVGIVGLGLVALAMLLVTLTSLGLWLSLRKLRAGEATQLECGYPTRTGFSISSLWFVPVVKVSWSWTNPEDATVKTFTQRRRHHEEVV